MDCSTTLNGSYCYVCGQREQRRVASLHSLVGEYVSGVLDWDSRVWRTLWPLFVKPGYLTKMYMEGKRERHSPPIRLYLISSIIFFLLISIAPRDFLNNVSDAVTAQTGKPGSGLDLGLDSTLSTDSLRAVADAMRAAGDIDIQSADEDEVSPLGIPSLVITDEIPEDISGPIIVLNRRDVASVDDPPPSDTPETAAAATDTRADVDGVAQNEDTPASGETVALDGDGEAGDAEAAGANVDSASNADSEGLDLSDVQISDECEEIKTEEFSPTFEFLRKPSYRFCKSVTTWRGMISFIDELVEKLPTTLFILLPLMAFVNKLLYLFSRRFYVEHLLYYVHNYSFVFLFTALLITISTVFGWVGVELGGLLSALGLLYVIYYFLKSIRVVYGQGYFMTISKWLIMLVSFFILTSMVLVFFLLGTAATVGM